MAEIAKTMGVSRTTIQRWKSGVHPPEIENLERLADVLGVSPWEFYKSEETVKKKEPVSNLLKLLSYIPDDIYELAEGFDHNDEVWGMVRSVMISERKRLKKNNNNTKHA